MTGIAGLYLGVLDFYRGVPFHSTFRECLLNTSKSRNQIIADQFLLLKQIVLFSLSNVAAYRGVVPEDDVNISLDTIDLLDRLPILSKKQLMDNLPRYESSFSEGRVFVGATSGSTGNSLLFKYDAIHLAWSEACKWRGRHWWGGERGGRALVLWGRPIVSERGGYFRKLQSLKSWLRNEIHFNTFESLDDRFLEKIVRHANSSRINYFYGYGSSLAALANYMKRNGLSLSEKYSPAFIQYTADHMSDHERLVAEEVFSAPVISDYGASELPGIALQCRNGRMHISSDAYVVEIVSDQGVRLGDGEIGEIVVTSLKNKTMPLLRYRIGDIGRLVPGQCSCGNNMPMMELVAGKAVDLITTSYASKISAHYLDYINIKLMREGCSAISQFQVIQHGRDLFELRVVPAGSDNLDICVDRFVGEIRAKLGPVTVDVGFVDSIPVEVSGKRRYFVDKSSAS